MMSFRTFKGWDVDMFTRSLLDNNGRKLQIQRMDEFELDQIEGSQGDMVRHAMTKEGIKVGDDIMTADVVPCYGKIVGISAEERCATVNVYEHLPEDEYIGFPQVDLEDVQLWKVPFSRIASRIHLIKEGRKALVNNACLDTAITMKKVK